MDRSALTLLVFVLLFPSFVFAQDAGGDPVPPPPPAVFREPQQDEKLSETLAKRLKELPADAVITSENRRRAYAKLLEGQRYIWTMRRTKSSNLGVNPGARKAKAALKMAVELDPRLAEGYTALAELSLTTPPQDIEEAIKLSEIATNLDSDNFGGYRFLARLYTIKSNIGRGTLNRGSAERAVSAWKEIGRLDPRNAEAWAFLSAFYEKEANQAEQIEALKRWLASAAPIERSFYNQIMRNEGELSPFSASLKLGRALIDAGRDKEALEVLVRTVSDQPRNLEAVELLGLVLDDASPGSYGPAIEALRQAVFANRSDYSLNELLARTLGKSGDLPGAEKVLRDAGQSVLQKDPRMAARYAAALGDIFSEARQTDRALAEYGRALEIRQIRKGRALKSDEKDFAFTVIDKMVRALEDVDRFSEASGLIARFRPYFPADDLGLDRRLVEVELTRGDRTAALGLVRRMRKKNPGDYSLIRTEASILTNLGEVDAGVSLIRDLIENKPSEAAPSVKYDDFVNFLFISSLYTQAGRGGDAVEAAREAYRAADGSERKQIARLTMASAQQASGDYKAAEANLRGILAETPRNPIALNNLGYLFLETGRNFQEALELIRGAVRIDKRNPSYLDSLGWAYFRLGQLDKAEKYLRRALRRDASSPTILEHLGDVLNANGKPKRAAEIWTKALRYAVQEDDRERLGKKLTK